MTPLTSLFVLSGAQSPLKFGLVLEAKNSLFSPLLRAVRVVSLSSIIRDNSRGPYILGPLLVREDNSEPYEFFPFFVRDNNCETRRQGNGVLAPP